MCGWVVWVVKYFVVHKYPCLHIHVYPFFLFSKEQTLQTESQTEKGRGKDVYFLFIFYVNRYLRSFESMSILLFYCFSMLEL